LIAFVGSVFSPYYAWARRRGEADPRNHCALNVAIYRKGAHHWSLTERGRNDLQQTADALMIGPSALAWRGDTLTFAIREITVPFPSRLTGTVSVHPSAISGQALTLDGNARHHWWPIAPTARVEVCFSRPPLRWSGFGYLDSNSGDEPLENAFSSWDWSRATAADGTFIFFDVKPKTGGDRNLALKFDSHGEASQQPPLQKQKLQKTLWRLERATRADASTAPKVLKTLEDAPFYARSTVAAQIWGKPVTMIHESLSLERFRQPAVQLMLPFRMPRRLR
jgi:carotenoid 1,2-hydratase